jgi:hypothetical protein
MAEQQTVEPNCKSCNKPLEYCPMCHGADPTDYAHQGQGDDGYWVCQDEDCESYQFCCGC